MKKLLISLLAGITALSMLAGCGAAPQPSSQSQPSPEPAPEVSQPKEDGVLRIAEQGIFSAGGIVVTSEGTFDPENQWEETGAGQTAHVDHANVFYQIPADETGLPMVFLHGYGQSRMGWMTTPDGREGWSDLFLKKGHSVFLIDEPRRGEAGGTSVAGTISTKTLDQRWYTQFRIGRWVDGKSVTNEGSQFPNDDASVEQFFRQMTPDTGMSSDMGGDFDNETVSKAVAAAIDEVYARTGKNSILVTHSQGGGPGWTAADYTDHIAAIVAIEPGGAPGADSPVFASVLSKNIPVTMYFGDYIDNGDPAIQATMMWQMMRQACYAFRDAYNAQGGNCTVVDLPQEGITGNDHFIFQDLNNDVVADHVEDWIKQNVSADGTYEPIAVTPTPAPEPSAASESSAPAAGKTLIVYFSASGNTKAVAETIAGHMDAELYELVPTEPYTSADLNWTNPDSRVCKEHEDTSHRTAISGTKDLSGYDTIFIGYPLWWQQAPSIVWNWVENSDLSGKTMIPFCTSSSSPFGTSGDTLAGMAPNANWLTGTRFGESLNASAVTQWVDGLGL